LSNDRKATASKGAALNTWNSQLTVDGRSFIMMTGGGCLSPVIQNPAEGHL